MVYLLKIPANNDHQGGLSPAEMEALGLNNPEANFDSSISEESSTEEESLSKDVRVMNKTPIKNDDIQKLRLIEALNNNFQGTSAFERIKTINWAISQRFEADIEILSKNKKEKPNFQTFRNRILLSLVDNRFDFSKEWLRLILALMRSIEKALLQINTITSPPISQTIIHSPIINKDISYPFNSGLKLLTDKEIIKLANFFNEIPFDYKKLILTESNPKNLSEGLRTGDINLIGDWDRFQIVMDIIEFILEQ